MKRPTSPARKAWDDFLHSGATGTAMRTTYFIATLFLFFGPALLAQEKKLEPLVVSYASVSGSRAPLWIAKEMGLFEKYGLDGRPIFVPAGYPSVSALIRATFISSPPVGRWLQRRPRRARRW
jgi:hypothetical protein